MDIEPSMHRSGRDRRLYIWAAVFIPLIVLTGFARTYYLKGVFGTPALPGLLVHLHGLVMTAWVVLFVVQVGLVSARRTKLHQRLGVLGALLAALVVLVGTLTAIAAAARGSSPGPPPLQFLVVPFGDLLVFAILFGTALYFRRRLQIHKRLMLLTALSLLTPAIARLPLHFIETGGPLVFFRLDRLVCAGLCRVRHRQAAQTPSGACMGHAVAHRVAAIAFNAGRDGYVAAVCDLAGAVSANRRTASSHNYTGHNYEKS